MPPHPPDATGAADYVLPPLRFVREYLGGTEVMDFRHQHCRDVWLHLHHGAEAQSVRTAKRILSEGEVVRGEGTSIERYTLMREDGLA